jgi:hypothetical protein
MYSILNRVIVSIQRLYLAFLEKSNKWTVLKTGYFIYFVRNLVQWRLMKTKWALTPSLTFWN